MEPDRISSELKTALAEERLVSETHLSDLETLKTEYLCLQQAHNKLKTDNEGLKSRMGHLQQTAREALGRGEFEKGTLLEQIQALRANQLTPERVEMLKADIAEGIEGITQEKVDRMTIESDRLRQELGKIRYNYSFLKSEYEHEVGRRNSIVEETERKHVIEISRLRKERDQLLVKLSSETEIDAKEMRVVARENAQLKQKISSLQIELDTYREQGDERLIETEELGQQIKSQLTETMIHVSSLEAEKATLSLQVERTQTELTRTRNQLQETLKESGRVKESLSVALNQLEEITHKHKMELTEVRMQTELRVADMDETKGNLTVKIRSLNDQLTDLNEQLIANENRNKEQERITAEKIQSVKESEWAKLGDLQENRIVLETRVTELEAILSGRETELSLQLEHSQDKVLSLQGELAASLKNRNQLEEQMKEMKTQETELQKDIAQFKSNMKKFSQLKNQYHSLVGSEQEYKQTNEQLNSRCLLLEEELKRCEYNHERILAEIQSGHERNREEISDEMNKLNRAAQELSLDKDKLKKQLEKIIRSARKMKYKYRQKLAEYEESLSVCKAERDKIETGNLAQKFSLESENERLCKKLGELQRRQHEFNFLIHNQEPQRTRTTDDIISVAATDGSDSNAKEIEFLNRKLENLTARHSQMLANLKEHSTRPLLLSGGDIGSEHQSDTSAKD